MTDGMLKKRVPFLRHERTRHGKWVWYFRRDRQRVRLPDEYGSDDFWLAYKSALAGDAGKSAQKATSGTLAWLVARYEESGHFASLRPSTRQTRGNIMKAVCRENGEVQFVHVTRKHIEAAMDRRATTPHAANNFLKVMSQLFKWAVANEHVETNPCLGVERRSDKTDGFHSWTIEEVEQFRRHHPIGSRARLALDLLLFTGLRRSDVILVGRQHVRSGILQMKTQKTGAEIVIPIFPDLQKSIDETETSDLAFLATGKGRPFSSAASFGNWFAKQCDKAMLPGNCRAHGLRKAGATIAAESGATSHELMAMFGWTRIAMAEVYTRKADRARMARGAAERIANRFSPHLEPTAKSVSKNDRKTGA